MCELLTSIYNRCRSVIKALLKFRYLSVAILLIAASVPLLAAAPVSANPGLNVTNAQIVVGVTPGETFQQTMTVSIGASDPATTITVQVAGVAQSSSGGYILLDSAQDTSQYSARTFVSVDQTSFQLQPGGSQDVTATIQVPQNVGDGARFAVINFATQPSAGSSGVNIITAVDVPVYLTINGSQLTQTGTVTAVTTGTITNGQPVDITTAFENTGNTYYKVQGSVAITNSAGATLETVPIPLTNSSIIPGMTRDLDAIYTPSGSLAPGTYTINSQVMLSDGTTVLGQSTGTFTVKAPYTPPPALGTVNLAPSGASTLQSTDGTISIYFPVGAAAVPVNLSLNSITASQLPAAPTGYTLTGNAFNAEGLTGLLAKNATVTVKYSADDLSKANGKASSLQLLRWDPGTNQWVVMKTKVNTKATTLTASSNQMGIWAVAVGAATSSGTNWMIIGIIAVVIIIAAIVIIVLIARRKPKQKPTKVS
jgi:hypothetical protein